MLILKRAPIGQNQEDYDVLADGALVGRIFLSAAAPESWQWMWTLAYGHHRDRTPTLGYAPTRAPGAGGGNKRKAVPALCPLRSACVRLVCAAANDVQCQLRTRRNKMASKSAHAESPPHWPNPRLLAPPLLI